MIGLRIFTVAALSLLASACVAQEEEARFREGVHYFAIPSAMAEPAGGDKVEVVEVFSYGCAHCSSFQPYISSWHDSKPDSVSFSRIPVVWRNWEPLARAYYTAEAMGIVETSHQPLFNALHRERQRIASISDLARFHSQFDVSEAQFLSTAQSFAVDMRLRQANKLAQQYGITATPSLVVNGKYRINANQAVNPATMIEVLQYLVEQEAGQSSAAAREDQTVADAQ